MQLSTTYWLGVLALLGVLSAPARLQAAAPAKQRTSPADVAAAQALFEHGRALIAKGNASEACPKFEESQRLDPALGTELNLAQCYEQLGKLASAYALFRKVAAAAHATGQAERAMLAEARADEVKPRLTQLAIVVPAGSAGTLRVERDGMEIREAEWGIAVPVDPGRHRVRAFGRDVGEWTTEIDIPADAGVHRVNIPGKPDAGGSFFEPLQHRLALVAAGVGVLGLGTGGYFALDALDKKDAADAAGCRGTWCPTPRGVELRASASKAGNLATVGVGIGVAGLATAAAFLWLLPDLEQRTESGATLALQLLAAPGTSAVFVGARF